MHNCVTQKKQYSTSNVTGRHQGLKWKLRAGYRASSLNTRPIYAVCFYVHTLYHSSWSFYAKSVCCASCIFHRRVWYRVLSLHYARAMHVFDIRASSSPLGYPCAKFCFCHTPHCWLRPRKKMRTQSITQSLTQLIWFPGNRSFCFATERFWKSSLLSFR